jgi:RNA polymerase sigma factor (sigma-70 family)
MPKSKKAAADRLTAAFLECRAMLSRTVGKIVRPHDIEDILQETYLRSFEAVGKRAIQHPRSFMFKTARNIALNHATRAGQRLTDHVADFSSLNVSLETGAIEAEVENRQRFLLFCRAVRDLPLQCRRVFLLKKVYGFSQKEIAAYLGLSESTVEKHIAKGLYMCTQYMADKERRTESPRGPVLAKRGVKRRGPG